MIKGINEWVKREGKYERLCLSSCAREGLPSNGFSSVEGAALMAAMGEQNTVGRPPIRFDVQGWLAMNLGSRITTAGNRERPHANGACPHVKK